MKDMSSRPNRHDERMEEVQVQEIPGHGNRDIRHGNRDTVDGKCPLRGIGEGSGGELQGHREERPGSLSAFGARDAGGAPRSVFFAPAGSLAQKC